MTHDEAMQYWHGRINYEQKSPRPSDLSLDRLRGLLARLDDPHRRLRIVHVAGTKGKGSTSAMLESIFRHAEYRTGLFSSPHLEDVSERFQVDRTPISRAELAVILTDIRDAATSCPNESPEPLDARLTYFEIATAIGFLHFVRRRVEIAVIEVGMGGRFDSTNVCQPIASVITTISFDHTKQLGNTLAAIAFEKSGIIKPGVPVVTGVRPAEARDVIEKIARERQAPIRRVDVDFGYDYSAWVEGKTQGGASNANLWTRRERFDDTVLNLLGEHQALNASVATATAMLLREAGMPISDAAVRKGLANVHWPARLERLSDRPLVIVDCAHNVASAHALLEAIESSFPNRRRRILLFAGSKDKDLTGMLDVLLPRFDKTILTTFHNSPRAAQADVVVSSLPEPLQRKCTIAPTVEAALRTARSNLTDADLLCITGSVYLAGEVKANWKSFEASRP